MGEIAAKELVRALSAQRDCGSCLAKLRQEPDRKRSGICARLVRVIGKLRDRIQQIQAGIQIYLLVLRLILLHDFPNVSRFIKAASAKRDRKCLEPGAGLRSRVMEDRGGIDAAAQPHSQGYVGDKVFPARFPPKGIDSLRGGLQTLLPDPKSQFPLAAGTRP